MSGSTDDSVTQWIHRLKVGDADAAQRLWERFSVRLLEHARRRLAASPVRVADEDDVVASVFESLCHGAANGRFADVRDRDALWWLLLAMAKQKLIDQFRYEAARKRADHATLGEDRVDLDKLVGEEPSPEFVFHLEEQHRHLMAILRDDSLRTVASRRIEGSTVPEIAKEMNVTARTIERKLAVIRARWSEELQR